MINCHFIDVLKTFNPDEIRRFREYLDSSYFNKRKKLVLLFDAIECYYPFFTDENFTREKIFYKIYSDEKYNYGKINEGLSALYKLSIGYIKQISFEKNEVYSDVTFLEGIRKRSLKNIFSLYSKDVDSKLSEFSNIDSNLFLKQYLVQIEKVNFQSTIGKANRKEKVENFIFEIRKMLIALCNFCVSEIISICVNKFTYAYAYAKTDEDIFEKIHRSDIFPRLLEIIKPFNEYDSYINLLQCFFEAIYDIDNDEKYFYYKGKVIENFHKMSVDDIGYHMNCLKSYCIMKRKRVSGGDEFTREYLNLQEIVLEKKLFANSKSEFFLKEQFINMLANYDALKDKAKIKKLLLYVKNLHPDFRDDMSSLTEAHYYYHCFSYNNSLNYLSRISRLDKTFEERINNLELRILFEMGKFYECIDKIKVFRKNYRMNTFLSKKRVIGELSFLNLLERIIKTKEKNDKTEAEFLKNKIEKDEFIPSKEWLIEKCYELYEKPKQISNY
ncbi:MAG: hypothetical protein K1X86_04320 [Ignavibacteria bacterium]|nr:hypothetical protein [Ignavibacteria bacterium]